MKYYFIHYETDCAGYTFDHKFALQINDVHNINDYIDENLREFWGDESSEKVGDNSYESNGGDVITKLKSLSELTESEYRTLYQYL